MVCNKCYFADDGGGYEQPSSPEGSLGLAMPAYVAAIPRPPVFFDFLPLDRDEEIIVLHELGALGVDANGVVKWSVDTDVIQDSSTDTKGNLILSVMEGPTLVVSLESGECCADVAAWAEQLPVTGARGGT